MRNEQDRRIAEVLAREGSRLRRFVFRRVRNAGDAEDVLQDVLSRLVEANRLLMPIDHLTGWLFRVARNRIADLFREAETEAREGPEVLELLPSPDAGPEAARARRDRLQSLARAIAELPPDQRAVFLGHEIDGKSFKEMAAETGVGVNTLLSRKRYAVLHLRERLRGRVRS
jgi:RNA polymerase sigma factor (sigma-70 family)